MSSPLRVLIADDHPPTRTGVRMALEGQGFVVCAEEADAHGAVEAALRERPDVCLLDVHMPGSGVAAAAQISSQLRETVVVMLTVSRSEADLFDALLAGARGYLLKDMEPDRLPRALHAVVDGEAVLAHALVGRVVDEFRRRDKRPSRVARRREADLTSREWQVLECLQQGLSTREIGKRLFVSDVTVRRHIGSILRKLNVSSREEAVRLAAERSRNLNGD